MRVTWKAVSFLIAIYAFCTVTIPVANAGTINQYTKWYWPQPNVARWFNTVNPATNNVSQLVHMHPDSDSVNSNYTAGGCFFTQALSGQFQWPQKVNDNGQVFVIPTYENYRINTHGWVDVPSLWRRCPESEAIAGACDFYEWERLTTIVSYQAYKEGLNGPWNNITTDSDHVILAKWNNPDDDYWIYTVAEYWNMSRGVPGIGIKAYDIVTVHSWSKPVGVWNPVRQESRQAMRFTEKWKCDGPASCNREPGQTWNIDRADWAAFNVGRSWATANYNTTPHTVTYLDSFGTYKNGKCRDESFDPNDFPNHPIPFSN